MLGGHTKIKEHAVLEYSRDALAAPLLALDVIYHDIRLGTFALDMSRAGRRGSFPTLDEQLGLCEGGAEGSTTAVELLGAENASSTSSQESDVSSDEDGGSSDSSNVPLPESDVAKAKEKDDAAEVGVFENTKAPFTQHLVKDVDDIAVDTEFKMRCGLSSRRLVLCSGGLGQLGMRCERCFARAE